MKCQSAVVAEVYASQYLSISYQPLQLLFGFCAFPVWKCYRDQEDQGETRISQPESAVLRSPGPRLLI